MTLDRWMQRVPLWLRSVFRRDVVDRELDDEFQYHIERQTAENIRRGMAPAAAQEAARRELGNIAFYKEEARDTRGTRSLDELLGDIRFGMRSLRRAPVFSVAVIATLALGIGANTAMFTLLRGTLLKPLPNRDGDRIVYIRQSAPGSNIKNAQFSIPEIVDLRAGAKTLAQVGDFSPASFSILDADGHPTLINAGVVSGNYFDVMGLKPVIGRLIGTVDDGAAVPSVTVLSYPFWQSHFGGDPHVVGRTVRLDTVLTTIVGVVQAAPQYPNPTDVLVNIVTSAHHLGAAMVTSRTHRMTEVFARLAPGRDVAEARAEVERVAANMRRDHPEGYDAKGHYGVELARLRDAVNERAALMFWLLMGAAGFVLLVACANVSNLTLMRGAEREREMVVRLALGAGHGRLRRLLLVENLLLALCGGVLGVFVSFASLKLLTAFAAQLTPRAPEIGIDSTILMVGLATSVVAAIFLSFIPRIGGRRVVGAALAPAGRRATLGRGAKRFQRSLVVVQVAVCMVLLTGSGLLLRTLAQLRSVDSGVRAENVLTLELPRGRTNKPANDPEIISRFTEIRNRIASLSEIKVAALGSFVPLRRAGGSQEIQADDEPTSTGASAQLASFRTADPNYFAAAGIPVLEGRAFTASDNLGAPLVAIVNRSLAKQLFGDREPIGRRIAWKGAPAMMIPLGENWRTIVGVVGDTRDAGLEHDPTPAVFEPFAQGGVFTAALLVRTTSDPRALQHSIVQYIHDAAPHQIIDNVSTLEEIRDASIVPRRLNAMFVASFAGLAFLIAVVGIAGVLASSVRSRTAELGIRMSLGAGPERLRRMVLAEGGVLIGLGIAIGFGGSVFTARLLRGLLFEVAPHDPTTFALAALLLAGVGILACAGPAARAATVDPATALRAD
jgi:putative ABC transport system permease protein